MHVNIFQFSEFIDFLSAVFDKTSTDQEHLKKKKKKKMLLFCYYINQKYAIFLHRGQPSYMHMCNVCVLLSFVVVVVVEFELV